MAKNCRCRIQLQFKQRRMSLLVHITIFVILLSRGAHCQNARVVIFTNRHQATERNLTTSGFRDARLTVKNILVTNIIVDGISERELCTQLLSPEVSDGRDGNRVGGESVLVSSSSPTNFSTPVPPPQSLPTYLFDLSSLDSLTTGQFGRKFALPSVRVSTLAEDTKSHNNNPWRALNINEREFLISVLTVPAILVNCVTDIARKFGYRKIIVLYDREFESAIHMHNFDGLEVELISWEGASTPEQNNNNNNNRRDNGKEIAKKFRDIKFRNLPTNNVFALGSLSSLNAILRSGYESYTFGPSFNWVVISHQTGSINCPACIHAHYYHIQPIESRIQEYSSPIDARLSGGLDALSGYFHYDLARFYARTIDRFIDDAYAILDQCETSRNWSTKAYFALSFEPTVNLFHGKYGNLILGEEKNYQEISMRIDKMTIVNGKVTANESLGEWLYEGDSPAGFYFKSAIERQQLSTVPHYRVITMVDPPFVMQVNDNTTVGNDRFYGYCIDLLREIANQSDFRFEYTIRLAEDDSYGFKDKNGRWGGLVGELYRNRADIAVAPMSVMAERENVIDYTVPFYDLVGISILMKKPTVQAHLFKFLTVLETSVWFCILGAYLFTSILLYLFDRYSPYSYRNTKEKHEHDEERREFTFKECLWFCMTSLTPQGGGEAPKNLSGRLVAATWWLFGFIIIASYTANLAAFLTVSRLESPIESLEDLSKQFKIKYASERGTSVTAYFERMAGIEDKFYEIWKAMSLNDSLSPDERAKFAVWDYPISDKYTKIWAQMQETGLPDSWVEGVRRVKSEKDQFAFIAKSTHVKYAVMTHCDLQNIGAEFSRKPLALGVQKNSELKERLSRAILKLLNERKLENLKEKWWNQNPERAECGDTVQSDGISLKNIGGVFVIILMGILIATVTLIVEYIYFRNKIKESPKRNSLGSKIHESVKTISHRFSQQPEVDGRGSRESKLDAGSEQSVGRESELGMRRNYPHYYTTNLASNLHHRQYPKL